VNTSDPDLGPLVEALAWYDEHSRIERAERIAWASSLYQSPGLVAGPIVPMHLMEEARISFVNGQYMAVVLSATSVIEHLLLAELENICAAGKTSTLRGAIETARTAKAFPAQFLDDADSLRNLRNPLVHRNADVGERSLYERYRNHEVHPTTLLERDARFALELMYAFFGAVLRPGA
jgi:hypothetical protein